MWWTPPGASRRLPERRPAPAGPPFTLRGAERAPARPLVPPGGPGAAGGAGPRRDVTAEAMTRNLGLSPAARSAVACYDPAEAVGTLRHEHPHATEAQLVAALRQAADISVAVADPDPAG